MLVDVPWLAARLREPGVRVVDVRWSLTGRRGRDAWAAGHVPGAAFADLDTELSRPGGAPGPGGRHPLPELDAFSRLLGRLGVTRDTLVVAYDDAGGAVAARLWWLLEHVGLENGRVLDGGLPAWIAAGLPLEDEGAFAPPPPAPPLALSARADDVIGADELARLRHDPRLVLLDARALERFEGRIEPVDPRAGHIPGARSAPTSANLEGGRFASPELLRARYEALGALDPARPVVCYCGSGVTACHDLLALRLLGRRDARLYPGSFSEWSADPARPVARLVADGAAH